MSVKIKRACCVFAFPVLIFLFFTLISDSFGVQSLKVVFSQAMIPTVMGFGMAFCMAAGLFDLSTGVRVILSASVGGYLATTLGLGLTGLIIGSIVSGVLMGIAMGYAFNLLRIPSLVLSLGVVMLFEILCYAFLGSSSMVSVDKSIAFLGKTPWNFVICAIAGVIFYLLYYRTKFSYNVRVVGGNEPLARNMGINAAKINFLSFVIGGAFLGVVGILQICYTNSISGQLSMGSLNMVFKPMMGVMVGMELLALMDNLALNILIGELCISLIFNGLLAVGLPSSMQDTVLGIFMIAVLGISANRGKMQHYFQKKKLIHSVSAH